MPEVFYQQIRRQKRHAAFSVAVFVSVLCLLPLALIAFRRYSLLAATLLAACGALISTWYLRSQRPPDAPELYEVSIPADDPAARLAACGAEQISVDAQALFATDGRLHVRVLVLECDDFDTQRFNRSKRRAIMTLTKNIALARRSPSPILIRSSV